MPSQASPPKSKMCKGKKYRTRAAAERGAERVEGREYRCPYCDGFHVSTKLRSKKTWK